MRRSSSLGAGGGGGPSETNGHGPMSEHERVVKAEAGWKSALTVAQEFKRKLEKALHDVRARDQELEALRSQQKDIHELHERLRSATVRQEASGKLIHDLNAKLVETVESKKVLEKRNWELDRDLQRMMRHLRRSDSAAGGGIPEEPPVALADGGSGSGGSAGGGEGFGGSQIAEKKSPEMPVLEAELERLKHEMYEMGQLRAHSKAMWKAAESEVMDLKARVEQHVKAEAAMRQGLVTVLADLKGKFVMIKEALIKAANDGTESTPFRTALTSTWDPRTLPGTPEGVSTSGHLASIAELIPDPDVYRGLKCIVQQLADLSAAVHRLGGREGAQGNESDSSSDRPLQKEEKKQPQPQPPQQQEQQQQQYSSSPVPPEGGRREPAATPAPTIPQRVIQHPVDQGDQGDHSQNGEGICSSRRESEDNVPFVYAGRHRRSSQQTQSSVTLSVEPASSGDDTEGYIINELRRAATQVDEDGQGNRRVSELTAISELGDGQHGEELEDHGGSDVGNEERLGSMREQPASSNRAYRRASSAPHPSTALQEAAAKQRFSTTSAYWPGRDYYHETISHEPSSNRSSFYGWASSVSSVHENEQSAANAAGAVQDPQVAGSPLRHLFVAIDPPLRPTSPPSSSHHGTQPQVTPVPAHVTQAAPPGTQHLERGGSAFPPIVPAHEGIEAAAAHDVRQTAGGPGSDRDRREIKAAAGGGGGSGAAASEQSQQRQEDQAAREPSTGGPSSTAAPAPGGSGPITDTRPGHDEGKEQDEADDAQPRQPAYGHTSQPTRQAEALSRQAAHDMLRVLVGRVMDRAGDELYDLCTSYSSTGTCSSSSSHSSPQRPFNNGDERGGGSHGERSRGRGGRRLLPRKRKAKDELSVPSRPASAAETASSSPSSKAKTSVAPSPSVLSHVSSASSSQVTPPPKTRQVRFCPSPPTTSPPRARRPRRIKDKHTAKGADASALDEEITRRQIALDEFLAAYGADISARHCPPYGRNNSSPCHYRRSTTSSRSRTLTPTNAVVGARRGPSAPGSPSPAAANHMHNRTPRSSQKKAADGGSGKAPKHHTGAKAVNNNRGRRRSCAGCE